MKKYFRTSLLSLLAIASPVLADTQSNMNLKVDFVAKVNGEAFSCTKTYKSVGTSKSFLTPRDFRFYVSNVRLINSEGKEVPLQLKQDKKWQYKNVALLDFENKTGTCKPGSKDINTSLVGYIPQGDYKGLVFDLGVPFELNHKDVSSAPAPLNSSAMYWIWRTGYKFARLDFSSKGFPKGYFVHLGSTGCGEVTKEHPDNEKISTTPPVSCTYPNLATIKLPLFEPKKNKIVADLGQLLSGSDIDNNKPNTAPGCMSGFGDSDCDSIYQHLGVSFGDSKAIEQTFFSLE
jgi:uncharacterized repeat protein (TIGR04052 family)